MNGLSPEAEELLARVRSDEVPDETTYDRAGRELLRRLVVGGSFTAIGGASLVAAASQGAVSSAQAASTLALGAKTTLDAGAVGAGSVVGGAGAAVAGGAGAAAGVGGGGLTTAALLTKVLSAKVVLIASVALAGGGIVGSFAVHEQRQSVGQTVAVSSAGVSSAGVSGHTDPQGPAPVASPLRSVPTPTAADVPALPLGASDATPAVTADSQQDLRGPEAPAPGANSQLQTSVSRKSVTTIGAGVSTSGGVDSAGAKSTQDPTRRDPGSSANFAAQSKGLAYEAAAPSNAPSPTPADSTALREQAAQLRQAERALAAGDPGEALKLLADSDERHGKAQGAAGLGLERAALRLIARCKGNAVQQAEGRAAAARFLELNAAHPLAERVRRDCAP